MTMRQWKLRVRWFFGFCKPPPVDRFFGLCDPPPGYRIEVNGVGHWRWVDVERDHISRGYARRCVAVLDAYDTERRLQYYEASRTWKPEVRP